MSTAAMVSDARVGFKLIPFLREDIGELGESFL
jgi:hypothetical protein